jgi:hypothetical protein
VDQRHATPDSAKPLEPRGFLRRAFSYPLPDLDRGTARSWIGLVALALFLAVAAACSSPDEGSASSQSALAEPGRWTLPASVSTVGAKVRVAYDEAPKWTNAAACGGKLLPGGHKLGEYLVDQFDAVTSVGGYACRRNTADSSRMSVHGTGRALDVFIPTAAGAADNSKGDKVANWLVLHAQKIGVQLVIWDKTIWRSNGRNDGAYGGPNPHADHIHVELSIDAAAMKTAWFSDMDDDAPDGSTESADSGSAEDDADSGDPNDDDTDAGTEPSPGSTDAGTRDSSTGTPDAGANKKDAAPIDPADDDTEHEEPDAEAAPGSGSGSGKAPGTGDPSDGLESAGDEPGETDSLPDVPKPKPKTSSSSRSTLDDPMPNKGCSAAPGGSHSRANDGGLLLALGLVLGVAAGRRRRR